MERSNDSDKMAIFREVCCSLFMLLLGLLFCLAIATLVYFSFESTAESVTACSLWVDIPGRLVIFMTCYYLASICGFFPLSQQYHLNSFIAPFNIWRLRSWRRLFRNICYPIRRLINWLQRNASPTRNSLEAPLIQEKNEESFHDNSQRRRESEPIDIRYPKSYIAPVFVSDPENTPRNESPEVKKSSDGSVTSISSSVGFFANQITKEKSSNRYCTSDASIKESPDDRVRVPSKYRKRYTEINWMGEETANTKLPLTHDHPIVAQRPGRPNVDNKSAALTGDGRLKISRQERQRLASEIPQVHTNEPVLVPRLSGHEYTLSRDESERLLEQKSLPLNEDEMFANKRDPKIGFKSEILKTNAADERFRQPTSTAVLFPKTNNQPRMHGRVKHPEGITVNYKIKTPPKYLEIYTDMKDANALELVDDDGNAPITNEQPLDDKYFAPVDDERHATSRLQKQKTSTFERLNLRDVDGQTESKRKELCTKTKIESTPHRRNWQPAGATTTSKQGTRPKLFKTETQRNFPGIRDSNKQPGEAIAYPSNFPNTVTTHVDDRAPVARDQPLDKYFEPVDDQRHATSRQQESTRSAFEMLNSYAADRQINVPTGKERCTETKIESTQHRRNWQPGWATVTDEQGTRSRLRNTNSQVNFPVIRDINQQPGGAIANPANVPNTVPPRIFPRIPWSNLRNPKGLPECVKKVHKRNLELEKREIERYYRRQRSEADLKRLMEELAGDTIHSEGIIQMQLPVSRENIKVIPRRTFQMRDFPTKCSDGQAVRHRTGTGIVKDKIDMTKNQYKVTEKQDVENMEKSSATNQGPPLFLQRSHLTQMQYLERSNAVEATTSHHLPSSQSFQEKMRSCSHTQVTAEDKANFKLEMHRRDDQQNSRQLAEAGPSNLSQFERDAERTGTLRPVTVESANESFNRLQLEGLRRRHLPFEHRTQTNTEASVTVESKPNFNTKREVRTIDVKDKESNVSPKPNDVIKPDVTISIDSSSSSGKSDSESGSEQSKK